MTSKFLHVENKNLLWNVMKETPFFLKDFTNDKVRQHWFDSIMYQFNENKNYSSDSLNAQNQRVVKFMMTELKTNNDTNNRNLANNKINKVEIPVILNNEPMNNMDELVKSHINERNLVLNQVFNRSNANDSNDSILNIQEYSMTDLSNRKVTFDDDEMKKNGNNQDKISLLQDNFQKEIISLQNNFQLQIKLLQINFEEQLQKLNNLI